MYYKKYDFSAISLQGSPPKPLFLVYSTATPVSFTLTYKENPLISSNTSSVETHKKIYIHKKNSQPFIFDTSSSKSGQKKAHITRICAILDKRRNIGITLDLSFHLGHLEMYSYPFLNVLQVQFFFFFTYTYSNRYIKIAMSIKIQEGQTQSIYRNIFPRKKSASYYNLEYCRTNI